MDLQAEEQMIVEETSTSGSARLIGGDGRQEGVDMVTLDLPHYLSV